MYTKAQQTMESFNALFGRVQLHMELCSKEKTIAWQQRYHIQLFGDSLLALPSG